MNESPSSPVPQTSPHSLLTVTPAEAGVRLDKFLVSRLPDLSRSRVQALIAEGQVWFCAGPPDTTGATISDAAFKVKPGQQFQLIIPEVTPSHIAAQAIPLSVVYEDAHLLVIDKPPGMTVHPAPGSPDQTLVNALLAHCGASLSGIGGVARPGIVHRIDKETSGLLVVAKHDAAHAALSAQLAARTLKRTYRALVWGALSPLSGRIEGNIGRSPKNRQKMAVLKHGGKPAMTHYETLERFFVGEKMPVASLLECRLETGRTHQIRVHLSHLGHPLLGDPVYGQKMSQRLAPQKIKLWPLETVETLTHFHRQALHAFRLTLIHPASGEEMTFEAPLPADLARLIQALRGS